MTPEEVAERITRGVEEQYVHSLLEAVTANLDVLGDPDPQTIYRVRRIHDLLPDELARVYLGYQGQILDEATYLLSEAAYDAGTEQALQDYTGHTPGLMYNYNYQRLHDVTVQGCVEVLNRYNVDLYGNMADKWYEVSMTAIAQAATYSKGKDQIIKQAVEDMRGITDITYKSGAKYPIDAAIRRHIETQLNQNHQRLTELRAAEYGWDLFMCSAHSDCRPTHYDFQGRVFSMGEHIGEIIDGRKVWDYAELGVGNVAGIYGANCRHYLTPYVPGYSEPQEPPYDERTNEERYDLTQKQRARERNVRAAKVEVYAAEQTGDPAAIAQARMKLGKAQRSLRDFCAEHDLVRRYDLERAYGIGKQPRGLGGGKAKTAGVAKAQKPTAPAFKPYKTADEARAYVEGFVDLRGYKAKVDIGKLDLECANGLAKALHDVSAAYDFELRSVQPMNFRTNKFKGSTSDAAYEWLTHDLYYNPNYYKSAKALQAHITEVRELEEVVRSGAERTIGTGKWTKAQEEYARGLLQSGRSNVGNDYADRFTEATFVHELGHALDDQVFYKMRKESGFDVSASKDKYATGISGYATASNHEYVAESFTAYMLGERDNLDPALVAIFEKARK